MKKIMKYVSIFFFFSAIGIFMILTIISPKNSFSENENRTLAELPKASVESFADKSYMNGIEEYVSDHFAFRNSLVAVKLQLDLFTGNKLQNGILIFDDKMIEPVSDADEKLVNSSIDAVNHLAEISYIPVYVMIVPTASGVYYSDLPEYYENIDQKSSIDEIYYRLSDKVTTLNVFSKLFSTRDEYIYYRNDHHWTSYGAYLAYNAAIRKMGYNPVPMSSYDIEHVNADFYGTFFSKTLYKGLMPDVIDVFHPKTGIDAVEVTVGYGSSAFTSESMYFHEFLNSKDKYRFYLNNAITPVVNIKTNLPDGDKLLVIKDSYAQCFIPFLTQHFSEITAVDLRSISPFDISSVIDINKYDKILILYNYSGFVADTDLKKLLLLE